MEKPYLIFDFDGTIVQSKMLAVELFNELSEKYGGDKIEDSKIAELSNLSLPDRMRALHVPLYKLPALILEGKREYWKAVVGLQPVEGMTGVLHSLKQKGYSLGLLSSNTRENIQAFLDLHYLHLFEFIHSASNLFGKDRAIASVGRKYRINRENMLYIGDELRDIQACKKIGVKVAAVTWGFDSATLLRGAGPDFLCHSPQEFENMLSIN